MRHRLSKTAVLIICCLALIVAKDFSWLHLLEVASAVLVGLTLARLPKSTTRLARVGETGIIVALFSWACVLSLLRGDYVALAIVAVAACAYLAPSGVYERIGGPLTFRDRR